MIVAVYFLASFLGAFLLFAVQPMIAKFLLPTLGGSVMVWNLCMLFFQIVLLAGYLYAHYTSRRLPPLKQALAHLAAFAVVALGFPLALDLQASTISPVAHPVIWQLATLALTVGLPFFMLSATSPLLQRWLAHSDHPLSRNPYVLFASSNFGSLLALIGYPFLIEPRIGLLAQAEMLRYGIVLQLLLLGACALLLRAGYAPARDGARAGAPEHDAGAPSGEQVAHWVWLAAVPSSILYGITAFIVTDIAAVPLLWVMPLALYLLTFVIIFLKPRGAAALSRWLHIPAAFMLMCLIQYGDVGNTWQIALHMASGFVIMMACHSRLADSKPAARHLTAYYSWMALGGILGGAFNTLLAPVVFDSIFEYPLAVLLSLAVFVPWRTLRRAGLRNFYTPQAATFVAFGLLVTLLIFAPYWAKQFRSRAFGLSDYFYYLAALGALVPFAFLSVKLRNAAVAGFAGLLLYYGYGALQDFGARDAVIFKERNYYGVHTVQRYGSTHTYSHGTTTHGMQSLKKDKRLQPTSYYVPLKEVIAAMEPSVASAPAAMLGLGVGTVLCFAQPGQAMDVYELNPLMVRIAENRKYFTYLSDCPGKADIIMGDGRLSLQNAEDSRYGLMVMDAFTSDAVPVHLLTREALALYKRKMSEKGIVAFNVSNRHIDLTPVIGSIAAANGMHAFSKTFKGSNKDLSYPSSWVIVSADASLQERLKGWKPLVSAGEDYLWTDDYSNILRSLNILDEKESAGEEIEDEKSSEKSPGDKKLDEKTPYKKDAEEK